MQGAFQQARQEESVKTMSWYEAFKKHCVNCSNGKKCYVPCFKFIKARFKKGDESICRVKVVAKGMLGVILIVLNMLNIKQIWRKNIKQEENKTA